MDDSDEVLDEESNVVSGGTFSKYFDRDVVKTIGNYEQMSGMDFSTTVTDVSPAICEVQFAYTGFDVEYLTPG